MILSWNGGEAPEGFSLDGLVRSMLDNSGLLSFTVLKDGAPHTVIIPKAGATIRVTKGSITITEAPNA